MASIRICGNCAGEGKRVFWTTGTGSYFPQQHAKITHPKELVYWETKPEAKREDARMWANLQKKYVEIWWTTPMS